MPLAEKTSCGSLKSSAENGLILSGLRTRSARRLFFSGIEWPPGPPILSFWLVFWWVPNGKVPVVQVFPAAFYTGVLAEVFKLVFGWILPLLDFQRAYGRVFWLPVTLLVWTYAGAVLLLFGASLSARGVIKMPRVRLRPQEPDYLGVGGGQDCEGNFLQAARTH